MQILKFFLFGLFLLSFQDSFGQQNERITPKAKSRIDSLYTKYAASMKKGGVAIAIVDTAGIVYSRGYGFADFDAQIPATDTTIFGIGSISKSFTAISILQLQKQGKLNVNESVKKYIPELTIKNSDGSENPLYISSLLAHISGLQGEILNGFFCDNPPPQASIIPELNKQYCAAADNYQFAYSNAGYGLLGETIQRISNLSYSNYLQKNILSPLGMNSTFISPSDPRHKNAAKTYIKGKSYVDAFIRDEAAGMIRSNVIDMGKYVTALLNAARGLDNKAFDAEMIRLMSTSRHDDLLLSRISSEYWGWGLYADKLTCKTDSTEATWVGHAGDTFGYHATMGFIPELGVGVIILTNTAEVSSARSTLSLMNEYLKANSKKTYSITPPKFELKNEYADASYNESIKGVYFMGDIPLKMDSKLRMVGKQGPAKLVFQRVHPDSTLYTVKAKLLGFIGIKVRDQYFRFENLNGNTYLKGINSKAKSEEFISINQRPTAIPQTWKNAMGTYSLASDFFSCKECPELNFDKFESVELLEKDGFILFKLRFEDKKETLDKYMIALDDTYAKSTGIGRGTGDTFKLLPNGNLYYSGFEFKKKIK